MLKTIRRTLNPACYHGTDRKRPFFEGWYFKLVDNTRSNRLAVIPGIFLADNNRDSHAFVQIFDGNTNETHYVRFPQKAFRFTEGEFDIAIAENHFAADKLILNIKNADITLKGELVFSGHVQWPVTLLSPGIMGWYAWVPFMECFHGIVSLDHRIEGELSLNGKRLDFSGGRGYTEKDWGRAFPQAWLWMQSNHFETPGASLIASTAIIPWIGSAFTGFIIGFYDGERLHRFATYLHSQLIEIEYKNGRLVLMAENKTHLLKLCAEQKRGGTLKAPKLKGMVREIQESLNSEINVQLCEKNGNDERVVFEQTGRCAGFEAAGDIDRLIAMWRAPKT